MLAAIIKLTDNIVRAAGQLGLQYCNVMTGRCLRCHSLPLEATEAFQKPLT